MRTSICPEDRILLACARQRFDDDRGRDVAGIASAHAVDWERLLRTAVEHKLAPLIHANLKKCKRHGLALPGDVDATFRQQTVDNVVVKRTRRRRFLELVDVVAKAGVPVMVIKGEALDLTVYDEPWYTASADIDVVFGKKREDVDDADHARITEAFRSRGFVENNWGYHHDVSLNRLLPIDFDRVWRDARVLDVEGRAIAVPAPEDSLVFSAVNAARKKYFRLKSLCDLAELIGASDMNWEMVADKAKAYGCPAIVYTALVATQELMAVEVPGAALKALGIGPLRRTVVRYLVKNMSFCSLASLHGSMVRVGPKNIGPALLLPYATYSWKQAFVGMVRKYHKQ